MRVNTSLGIFDRFVLPWLAVLLIVLVGYGAYHNSFGGPFVLDDPGSIYNNPSIGSLWESVFPPKGQTVSLRPVVNLTLALNYRWHQDRVFGYHVMNLAIHCVAGIVLFFLLKKTLLILGMPGETPQKPSNLFVSDLQSLRLCHGLSLVGTLVWLVHPLQTESVTYMIQRGEALLGLFFMLTMYLAAGTMVAQGRWKWVWGTASVLSCLVGMGCKEVMAVAPLVIMMYDRVFVAGSWKEVFKKRWLLYVMLWMMLGWLVFEMWRTKNFDRHGTAGFGVQKNSAWEGFVLTWDYFVTQWWAVCRYLKLALWPTDLVFDYGTELMPFKKAWPYGLLLVSLGLAGVWMFLGKRQWIGFLILSFFFILAPSSSFVPIVTQTAAEHRMYLPLAMVVGLVVVGGYLGWRNHVAGWRLSVGVRRWCEVGIPLIILIVLVGILGQKTILRNKDYATDKSIWLDTINKRPENKRALVNLVGVLIARQEFATAKEYVDHLIAIDMFNSDAYTHRGSIGIALGQPANAVADLTRSLQLRSTSGGWRLRAQALLQMGHYNQALSDINEAINLEPMASWLYADRSNLYTMLGQLDKALEDAQKAVDLTKRFEPYLQRARVWLAMGQLQKVWEDLAEYRRRGGSEQAEPFLQLQAALQSQAKFPAADSLPK